MSVPIAVTGEIPKIRISSGVISDAPPMPVMPTSSPMPSPKRMIAGSMCSARLAGRQEPVTPFFTFVDCLGRKMRARQRSSVPRRSQRSALYPGLGIVEDRVDAPGQLALGDLGEAGLLQDPAEVGAHRDPYVAQALGRPLVVEVLRRRLVDVGKRSLYGPDDICDRDLLGGPVEPVAALVAALGADQPRVLELQQDVLQELQRDSLALGELLALHRLALG